MPAAAAGTLAESGAVPVSGITIDDITGADLSWPACRGQTPARAAPSMNGERAPQAAAGGKPAAQAVPRRQRWAITAPAAGAAAVSWVVLDRLAPFRFGLLSVALYAVPAAVAVVAVRRTRKIPVTRDRRRTLGQALAIMAGLLVLAVPFGYLQRAVAPAAWMAESGIPSRAYLQVIIIPGMTQEPYVREGDQVTAYFDEPLDPSDFLSPDAWSAIETVGSGSQDPCATLYYPAGEDQVASAARCTKAGLGLWMLTTSDGSSAGFVRRANGVTITLTGSDGDKAALRHAIMAAHRAGDAELWPRIGPAPVNLFFL
jgi:hypothetical protein